MKKWEKCIVTVIILLVVGLFVLHLSRGEVTQQEEQSAPEMVQTFTVIPATTKPTNEYRRNIVPPPVESYDYDYNPRDPNGDGTARVSAKITPTYE